MSHLCVYFFALKQFRSEIPLRTASCLHLLPLVLVIDECSGKSKIGNLESIIFIEEQVLRLEIAVSNSQFVHCLQSVDHLVEIRPRRIFVKSIREHQKVEQLTASSKLQNSHNAFCFIPV